MDHYIYLLFDTFLLVPLLYCLSTRKDLATAVTKLGLLGGVAGLLSELFYLRDYWRPPTIVGTGRIAPEDFLFGFAITSLSVLIYPTLTKQSFTRGTGHGQKKLFGLFLLFALFSLLVFNVWIGINSIVVSSALFLCLAVIMSLIRKDLVKPAIISCLVLTVSIICVYVLLFDVVDPHYWNRYWLLYNTSLGYMVLGNVPITEIIWYLCWIPFASICYPFTTGKILTKLQGSP
jgi:hypothetical protein